MRDQTEDMDLQKLGQLANEGTEPCQVARQSLLEAQGVYRHHCVKPQAPESLYRTAVHSDI